MHAGSHYPSEFSQLYTRTEDPPPGLVRVVTFIQQVYAHSWFQIKSHSHFTADPSNLFMQMRRAVKLPQEDQSIIRPVVQRNAYFAHPSTMLCAGLASEESSVRRKEVNLIRDIRKKPPKPPRAKVLKKVRKYKIPPLQWDSEHWWDIIDWKTTVVHQPAILSKMSDADLALDHFYSLCIYLPYPSFLFLPCSFIWNKINIIYSHHPPTYI